MNKTLLILFAIIVPTFIFAGWGDEEENGEVYQWRPIYPYSFEPYAVFYEMSVLDSTHAIALIEGRKVVI